MFRIIALTAAALCANFAFALEVKPYSADALTAAQSAGKPVAVHFHADWCPTCVNQSKAIDTLKSDTALKDVVVLVANYDQEKELRKSLKIRSQSVFVVYKGANEVGRIAGDTDPMKIKAGLAKAL